MGMNFVQACGVVAKGKDEDGNGAPPGGRELLERELACLAKGRSNWQLTLCW